jgi:AhpD family alkylhydroperoxidase
VTQSKTVRIRPLQSEELDERQRTALRGSVAAADRYLTGAADAPPLPGILGLFARHPDLSARFLSFSGAILDSDVLPAVDRELLTLRVAARTDCDYLWSEHIAIAARAGLSSQQIEAIRLRALSSSWQGTQRDLLCAADELIDTHVVSGDTWARLTKSFDEQQLLEVLFVVGSYVCLALVLNSAGLEAGVA